jgi:cytoskeletal protein CcmA (bactofilin family)
MTESDRTTGGRRAVTVGGIAVGAAVLVLGVASPAAALEPRTGDDITIDVGETVDDDLYVAADTLTVDGTVEGDLVVAAREVVIDGEVEGDLVVAAQTVVVAGEVADDVRAAAAEFVVEEGAEIGDDVIVLGYALEAQEGSAIGGDVVVLGRQGLLDGEVADRLWGAGQGIEIGGTVGGDVDVTVGGDGGRVVPPQGLAVDPVAGGLTIRDSAVIDGDVRYEAPDEADIAADARIAGEVVYDEIGAPDDEGVVDEVVTPVVNAARTFATLAVVGFLLVWLLPGASAAVAGTLRRRPWPSLGWGALFVPLVAVAFGVIGFATVVLAVLLGLVTLGGLAGFVVAAGVIAALLLALLTGIAALLLAPIVVSFLVGRLILRRPWPDDLGGRVVALLVGVAIYAVLQALPVVGWVVALPVTLIGIGAIVVWLWSSRGRRLRGVTADEAPVPGDAGRQD